MFKTIRFPIKGSFYYDAMRLFQQGELTPSALIEFRAEPHNPFDANAIQIWTGENLLGYVPRVLAQHFPKHPLQIKLIKVQTHRRFLWLECQLNYQTSFWQHLKLLGLSAIVRLHYRLKLWLTF